MIDELRIRDLGVIHDAVLPLGPGFTAITGETGAGKTMVVTALGLLMGERADAGAVRSGQPQARVSGVICSADETVVGIVDELGGVVEDGELALARTVSSEGRSRAIVGGASTPVGALGRLAEHLFAVHGQSDQLRVRSLSVQRDTLDRFGGEALLGLLGAFRGAHQERADLERRLRGLQDSVDAREAEVARLRESLEEISAVDPQPGEEGELELRMRLLEHAEDLRSASASALEALASESADPMVRDAGTLVDGAVRDLERVADHDPRLEQILGDLRGVGFSLAEVSRELGSYAGDLDQDAPGELARVQERWSELQALLRKYGGSSEAVIRAANEAAEQLARLERDDESLDGLETRLRAAREAEAESSRRLTAARREAAERLGTLVTAELRELALPDAKFVVEVRSLSRIGADGGDEVEFLLAPHPGAAPRSVGKAASGGELSRVMLALEVVLAGTDPVPTFVFDEVDAGIGGAAAIEIGRRLARLSENSQVIVVTHLAQVAAFADNHIVVQKDSAGGFTESSCRVLHGEERLAEMARLLSGLADSRSALDHAAELLVLSRG